MARENRFVILMSAEEREAVERLAAVERLPASTLARKRLLEMCDQRGIYPVRKEGHREAITA